MGFVLDADFFLNRDDYETTFNAFIYLKKLVFLFRDALYVFTSHKDYYLFKCLNQDWRNFYESELLSRRQSQLPPFGLIIKITLRAKNKKFLLKNARNLYNKLGRKFKEIYGPFEEKPFKLRDKFRYSLVIKAKNDFISRKIIKDEVKEFRTSLLQIAVSLR
jgi:primosomal protein N' (replication factor Y)